MDKLSIRQAEPSIIAKAAEYVSNSTMGLLLNIGWTPFITAMRKEIFKMFKNIKLGELLIVLPDGSGHHFGNRNDPLSAKLSVKSERLWIRLVLYKDLGLAEGYIADECDISDITQFLKILVLNRPSLEAKGTNFASQLFEALEYAINTRFVNSIANTLGNISAHYDIGNDMFSQILDPTLTYSCPIWEECEGIGSSSSTRCSTPNTIQLIDEFIALEKAQLRKLNTIIQKAKLVESDHLLEIGTGWGSLSIEAVRQTGCRVTTLTLSAEQKALAETKICEAGLSHRISVVLMDYRKVHQLGIVFDKIISIEMLEAVGKEYIPIYFEVCNNVLKKDGGIMVFQCITIHEPLYYNYCRQVEFIQKYIFPGGHLPTITVLTNAINQGSKGSLIINEVTNIGAHYIRTLRLWREKFDANFSSIEKHDPARYTPQFKRTWDYYFSYCEAGFAMHCLGDVITVLTRQNNLAIAEGVPM